MANCIIIMGASGTGKSTSIKTLNPDETVIINVLGKRLPFPGSQSMYNAERKNIFRLKDADSINNLLRGIDKPTKPDAPYIRNVVIDDGGFVMRSEYFNRAKESGFNKFTEIAQHFQSIIATCETLRDDLNVFLIMHIEEIMSDGTIVGYQPATIGKMLISQYNPIECVPMVLFSVATYDDKGKPTFGFITHRIKIGTAEMCSKTPEGMFQDDVIPNDLGMVVKAMDEYYK